jgi:hypothetical protein
VNGFGTAGAAMVTVTGAQVLSALVSPLPLLVFSGVVALVWMPVAVLLLTPLWSTCRSATPAPLQCSTASWPPSLVPATPALTPRRVAAAGPAARSPLPRSADRTGRTRRIR